MPGARPPMRLTTEAIISIGRPHYFSFITHHHLCLITVYVAHAVGSRACKA